MKKTSNSTTTTAKATKANKVSALARKSAVSEFAKPTITTANEFPPPHVKTTKIGRCLELLTAPDGATIDELQTATGWQAHSVRGFLAGTVKKKLGLILESKKADDGIRRYHVVKAEA